MDEFPEDSGAYSVEMVTIYDIDEGRQRFWVPVDRNGCCWVEEHYEKDYEWCSCPVCGMSICLFCGIVHDEMHRTLGENDGSCEKCGDSCESSLSGLCPQCSDDEKEDDESEDVPP